MTDEPTDEELAMLEERNAPPGNDDSAYALRTMLQLGRRDNRRLIAALRASRKREEEYLRVMQLHTKVVTRMDDELQTERAENERLQRITEAWGDLEFSSRWAGPAGP